MDSEQDRTMQTIIRRLEQSERRLRDLSTVQNGYSMGDVIGTVLGFPGLRGFWPFSSVNESGNVLDMSEQGRTLTNNNAATFAVENNIIPYTVLNGTNQFFSRADEAGLDITGELTLGGWFYTTSLAGIQTPISKDNGVAQRSYLLRLNTDGSLGFTAFAVSGVTATTSAGGISTGQYFFGAGRYTPSTEVAVWANTEKEINTTSVPASINNSTTALNIGAANGANLLAGRAALCFLCAAALPDSLIKRFYSISRVLFGV